MLQILGLNMKKWSLLTGSQTLDFIGSSKTRVLSLRTGENQSMTLDAMPNPFEGSFSVLLMSQVTGFYQLTLRDVNGKEIYQANHLKVNERVVLDNLPAHLPKGIYLLEAKKAGKIIRHRVFH